MGSNTFLFLCVARFVFGIVQSYCCFFLFFHPSFFCLTYSLKTQLFRFRLSLLSVSVPRTHLKTLSFSLALSLPRPSLYTPPSLSLSQLHSSHTHRLGGKRETTGQISRSLRTHSLFDYLFDSGHHSNQPTPFLIYFVLL